MSTPAKSQAMNDTRDVPREPPKWRSFSKPFWDATREKKVRIQFCKASGKYQFFPRATSIYTGRARDLEWRDVSGKGAVYSWTIARRARPPFQGHEPFIIGVITLDEGVNVMGDVINCTAEEMKVGLRMKPAWLPLSNGCNLLVFEPDR